MTPPYRPPAIRDVGLQQYLDVSASKHNDSNYAEFKRLAENKVSPLGISRVFKVSRQTIHNWLSIFNEEQNNE